MSDIEEVTQTAKRPRVQGPLAPIAHPLANEKLSKKVYKVVKKASSNKVIKRGVKEVVKALRKGDKGLCILAGDISPIDVISHIPVLCEDNSIPYVYVDSKADLGSAAATKRPTSVVLITPGKKYSDAERYDEVLEKVKSLNSEA